MAFSTRAYGFFLALSFMSYVQSIRVAVGSPCTTVCTDEAAGDIASTNSTYTQSPELMCDDPEILSKDARAVRWRECIQCLDRSTYNSSQTVPPGDNDLYWLLFNLRFAVDHCIFGNLSNNATEPAASECRETCQPIESAIRTRPTSTNFSSLYDHCNYDNGTTIGVARSVCIDCLRKPGPIKSNSEVIGNYLSSLGRACQNDPRLEPGMALNLTSAYSYFYDWETVLKKRMWGNALAGIIVASIFGPPLVVLVVCLIIVYLVRHCRRRKKGQDLAPDCSHSDVEHTAASEASTVVGSLSRPQSVVALQCETCGSKVKNDVTT